MVSDLVSAWARGPRRLARVRLLRPLTELEAARTVRLVTPAELDRALREAVRVSRDNWARQQSRSGPYR